MHTAATTHTGPIHRPYAAQRKPPYNCPERGPTGIYANDDGYRSNKIQAHKQTYGGEHTPRWTQLAVHGAYMTACAAGCDSITYLMIRYVNN